MGRREGGVRVRLRCTGRRWAEGEVGTWREGRRVGRTVGEALGGALGATVGRDGAAVHAGDFEMEGSAVGRRVYDGLWWQ